MGVPTAGEIGNILLPWLLMGAGSSRLRDVQTSEGAGSSRYFLVLVAAILSSHSPAFNHTPFCWDVKIFIDKAVDQSID